MQQDGQSVLEVQELRDEVQHLRKALESRAEIDQACGIVMALAECSSDGAWQVLVEVSQHTNIKLREIAAELIAGTGSGGRLQGKTRSAFGDAIRNVQGPSAGT